MPYTPYVKQTWVDNTSPPSAARFNFMEQGIFDAHFRPGVKVASSAAQSIANATYVTVSFAAAFAAENYDTNAMHDPVTNPSRLTAKVAGYYLVTAFGQFGVSGVGNNRYADLFYNGGGGIAADSAPILGGGAPRFCVTGVHLFSVNDYIELRVFQDSGGALNLDQPYAIAMHLLSY